MSRANSYTCCQLCDHAKARDGNTMGVGIARIADVRLCARHLELLVEIAAENHVNLADEYLRKSA